MHSNWIIHSLAHSHIQFVRKNKIVFYLSPYFSSSPFLFIFQNLIFSDTESDVIPFLQILHCFLTNFRRKCKFLSMSYKFLSANFLDSSFTRLLIYGTNIAPQIHSFSSMPMHLCGPFCLLWPSTTTLSPLSVLNSRLVAAWKAFWSIPWTFTRSFSYAYKHPLQ